jgi:hypothetical protein
MKYEQRTPQLRLKLEGWRSRFVLMLAMAGFAVLAGRAFFLQGMDTGFLQAKGEARYGRVVEMPSGLSLPLAFGINTRLIGSGRYVSSLSASASSASHRSTPYDSMSTKS